ncbi:signal peptidase II [Pontixanthobacter aestiaquae]|uniref:Lipoprotein signal peptidase n=1 Tax=Pontixanthobacter aestiaquae TaxID=1509367 RepID=A0A844YZX2_9SPHN|nr:signal peptidase II [Pontixanthobacter aestiaquae]MDN3646988.1 signal peptidase II [Pontixanthobacter aestiaquae]MXO82031.1 signal peptidase II [Pontixanthobacter aestiaquae]
MSILTKPRLIGLAIAAIIFAADQWIKDYVTGPLEINQRGDFMEILPFFDLRFTQNFGISLGLFEATSPEMRWALVLVTALIAFVVFIWMLREKAFGDILGLSMILGGALGNIVDRYTLGYVVDYADLHFGDFRPFLIFNVADAAITIGVVIILARSFFVRDKEEDHDIEPAQT